MYCCPETKLKVCPKKFRQEQNGTELEAIDDVMPDTHWKIGVNMSAHQCTESLSRILYQPRRWDKHPADSIEPPKRIKHSSRLPGIFVRHRRPFAYRGWQWA